MTLEIRDSVVECGAPAPLCTIPHSH